MKIYKNYIKKKSWFYEIIRWPISMALIFFYKKFIVTGKENIPRNTPVIIAPNHQNAALDAYNIITSLPFLQPVFLSRADIFDKPVLSWILQMIKILPVYRSRDGGNTIDKNKEIFNLSIEVLEKRNFVGTFPEARHNNKRFLMPLKKGIPRIAFAAEEKNNFSLGVMILPVGIYYDNYFNSGSILMINYGKPIAVADYIPLYKENQAKALLALSNEMRKAIKSLMIDISNQEYNDQYELLRFVYNSNMREILGMSKNSQINQFKADQKIIEMLDNTLVNQRDLFNRIIEKTNAYNEILKIENFNDCIVMKNNDFAKLTLKTLSLIAFLPVFIYSYLNNILPVLPSYVLIKTFKEKQFHSTVKFVLSLMVFPVFYGVQTWVVYLLSGQSLICLAYFISLFAAINIFVNCRRWYTDLYKSWQFFFKRNSSLALTLTLRSQTIELMDEAYSKIKSL